MEYEKIEQMINDTLEAVNKLDNSRPKALLITKLEEAMFWLQYGKEDK